MDSHPLHTRSEYAALQPAVPAVPVQNRSTQDHIVWSIFNLIHCNPCCLGLVALLFSVRARDLKVVGDVEGARAQGKKAMWANIVAVVVTSLAVVITVVTVIVLTIQVHTYHRGHGW